MIDKALASVAVGVGLVGALVLSGSNRRPVQTSNTSTVRATASIASVGSTGPLSAASFARVPPALQLRDDELIRLLSDKGLTDARKLDTIWSLYRKHRDDPLWACYYIDSMRAVPIGEGTRAFAKRVEAEIRDAKLDSTIRVSLVRTLAGFYERGRNLSGPTAEESNAAILVALRDFASMGGQLVSNAAVMEYVRLGYFDDSVKMLGDAKNANVIDPQTYVKEMLLQIPALSTSKQSAALESILSSGLLQSEVSEEIVGTVAISPDFQARISSSARATLLELLANNEPRFSIDTYDALDAVKYVDWLAAQAALRSAPVSAQSMAQFISTTMLSADDPKKVAAIMTSSYSETVIDELIRAKHGEEAIRKINYFESQLAPSSPVRMILNDTKNALESRIRRN